MPAGQQAEQERDFLSRWRLLVDKAGGSGGQARVAKKLGWTTSTVSRDYKGNTLPTDERLDQLCGFLGLPQKDALHLAALLQHARAARKSRLKAGGTEAAEETDDKSWYPNGQRQESAPATQEQQTARVRSGTRRERSARVRRDLRWHKLVRWLVRWLVRRQVRRQVLLGQYHRATAVRRLVRKRGRLGLAPADGQGPAARRPGRARARRHYTAD